MSQIPLKYMPCGGRMCYESISFKPEWWDECEKVARGRSDCHIGMGKGKEFKDGRLSSYESHLVGVIAEAAVCIYCGQELNREILPGGDGHRPDLVMGDLAIEVKASQYTPPYLRIDAQAEEFQSDIAMLVFVSIQKRETEFWGWISREEFIEKSSLTDLGHGERLVMKPPFRDPALLHTISSPPKAPCYACRREDWWLSWEGGWTCRVCHPPVEGVEWLGMARHGSSP